MYGGRVVLSLLLLSALMTVQVSADWWRSAKKAATDYAKSYAAKKVATWAVAAIGKRGVGAGGCVVRDEAVTQLAQNLQTACSKLPSDPKDHGLTKTQLDKVFKDMDGNGDDILKAGELKKFAKVIETYEDCIGLAKSIKNQQ